MDIALDNGDAFTGDGWEFIKGSFAKNTVHFIGLLSDGGVHSRYNQLAAFLKGAQKDGAKSIRVHILTVPPPPPLGFSSTQTYEGWISAEDKDLQDEKDVPEDSSIKYVEH